MRTWSNPPGTAALVCATTTINILLLCASCAGERATAAAPAVESAARPTAPSEASDSGGMPMGGEVTAPTGASSEPDETGAYAGESRHREREQQVRKTIERNCPMKVPNTTITAVDTDEGVALIFETTSRYRKELTKRLGLLAGMHNDFCGPLAHANARMPCFAGMMRGSTSEYSQGADEGMTDGEGALASQADFEPSSRGGRVFFTPDVPEEAARLREQVHLHAQRMVQMRGCPVLKTTY